MLDYYKSSRGYTVTELLVTIGIFVMITGLAIANLRGGSPGQEVRLQAENLTSLLTDAKLRSATGASHNNIIPTGGFGVEISECASPPCAAILFADNNANFGLDPGEEVETITLGQDVTVASISEGASVHILFKPPRPIVCYNNECSGLDDLSITLGHRSAAFTSEVTITPLSAQISFE